MKHLILVLRILASYLAISCGLQPPTNPLAGAPARPENVAYCAKAAIAWDWQAANCQDARSVAGNLYSGYPFNDDRFKRFQFQEDSTVVITIAGSDPQKMRYEQHGTCLRIYIYPSGCEGIFNQFYTVDTNGSRFTDDKQHNFGQIIIE